MVQYEDIDLDRVFAALADGTRRQVLAALGEGPSSVSALAEPHGMSLTGFMKHLRVLEDAGLIQREKSGRVVHCDLNAGPLQEAAVWLSRYRKFWSERFDALGAYLLQQEQVQEESAAWTSPSNPPSPPRGKGPASNSSGTTRSRPKKSGGPGPTPKS